jgi:hypothetical protein
MNSGKTGSGRELLGLIDRRHVAVHSVIVTSRYNQNRTPSDADLKPQRRFDAADRQKPSGDGTSDVRAAILNSVT